MKTDHKKNYHVVFKNRYVSNIDPKIAQRNFVLQFKIPANATKRIFSGKRIRIKKGISQQSALKVQDKLFQMGILCDIELDATPVAKQTKPAVKQLASQPKHKAISADSDADEDDEDDEDVEADFDLADILMQAGSTEIDTKNTKSIIEVIKCHENNIIDIQYLQKKQKYIDTNSHFCLAEHDRNQNAYFYFDDFIQGSIHNADQTTIETEAMRTSANLSKQSKRIYRSIIPDDGYVALSDDLHTYYLRKKTSHYLPPQAIPKKPKSYAMKNITRSIVCHFLIIVLIGMFVSFEKQETSQKPRYAKIAGNKIHDLQKLRKQRQESVRPRKTEIVQMTPQKTVPAAKKAPVKKKSKKVAKRRVDLNKSNTVAKNQRLGKQHKQKQPKVAVKFSGRQTGKRASSQTQTGSGGGTVGNVSTPDIKQKGLLGMIKDTGLGLLPNEALAAVTQLDTVDVLGSFDTDTLKIGGVKGNVGDRKVQMPIHSGGGRVNTKGSHQVLRTGGGDGTGGKGSGGGKQVGELARGNTGNNAVKAMIRANFKQSVHRIHGGGMSRAAVKKVIDQHIDDISYCYEVALISDPSIVGKAVYEWHILLDGSVGDVHILNASIQNQQILGCIKKSIKTWRFPQPHQSQVLVSYPFVFDIVGF